MYYIRLKNNLQPIVKEKLSLKQKVKHIIMEQVDLSREVEDETILELIDEVLLEEESVKGVSLKEKLQLQREIFNGIRRLDVLQELIESETITEIMINGIDNIFVEETGKLRRWHQSFESKEKLEDIIQQIVSKVNRIINEANPIVDVRLLDGSRVNVVLPPVAINGPIVTIRKFPSEPITIETLLETGSITNDVVNFLKKLVVAKYNIFISGGTGSGKTTFLNVLSNFIPEEERIITIEDSAELQIRNIPNLVRLETRNANVEGENAITIRNLIKSSLRMRPDRIIIGEVRDTAAIDMLNALNTGHDGSLSTGHGNSTHDMLSRLETLVLMGMDIPLLAVRRQIASAIDIVIHLGRLRDKSRKILEVAEIVDFKDGEILINPLYQFQEDGMKKGKITGKLAKTQYSLTNIEKLERAGISME